MLTLEWQPLTPRHGFTMPGEVSEAGAESLFLEAMDRSAELFEDLRASFPHQAPYAVALAYKVRFVMQMNAREAMHLIELRTAPAGHPDYRTRLPGDVAAHPRRGRPSRHRRGHAPRGHEQPRPRAARRRAAGGGEAGHPLDLDTNVT